MRNNTNSVIPALCFVIFLTSVSFTPTTAMWPYDRTTVYIRSLLISKDGKYSPLTVHCKDKEHDIGVTQLAYNESFKFEFQPSFWGSTLYFCGFTWDNVVHWFDIYVQNRDAGICFLFCKWVVNATGPCLHNDVFPTSKVQLKCYDWNKQTLIV